MGKKRAFIIGAGFSKQAGMPLATELTNLVLNAEGLRDHEEMQAWMTDFKERLAAVQGAGVEASSFSPNVEQLFDFARYDQELWRMMQQLAPVERRCAGSPHNMAEDISTWLNYMQEELFHIIWDAQKQANLEPIKRFGDQIANDDTVLTFNYDTLVETALSKRGQPWNYGLNDRTNGGVTVLKMHGSIDWILLQPRPENQLENFAKLFSKRDIDADKHGCEAPKEEEYAWELWRAKDATTCNAVIDMDETGLSNFPYALGLAGLGRYKPLHRLPGSAQTWLGAFQALSSADEIYVVGFSMSPYDTMTRFHFTSKIRRRSNPFRKVVIIDPNALRLAETYSTVFGRDLTLKAVKAEAVDWQRTLGQ